MIDRAVIWAENGDVVTVTNLDTDQQIVQFTIYK